MNRYREKFQQVEGHWYIARWTAGRYASLSRDDEMQSTDGFTMGIDQALVVMNGDFTNALSACGKDSLLERLATTNKTCEERLDALYQTVLSHKPTKQESRRIEAYFREAKSPTQAAGDLLYALLMSTEFATNR